ncbi:amino acid ABC transporter permease [Acuticoccus sp. I52.16.1]|uniref:amino acid ABC transporter permease n=1 Tax=Acuticoccus sp. I52.16.1 TaxID=2928472 RepID=UPI001FCFB661|nr:amino acid ABC transporter permease [Acuticoccus sp. I52.16.1]UOM33114.1 amino acid ABC transporter permease [Acuticoccus sp. I52.16.1]
MNLDPGVVVAYLPAIGHGLLLTLFAWIVSSVLGIALGLGLALAGGSRLAPLRWTVRGYIELMRCTPILVQLLLVYGGGPSIGLFLEPMEAGILVLTAHGAAYFAEIFRGGFAAVPAGQVEAAHSLGMHPLAILRRVTLPIALTAALPGMINMIINVCKETAVLSIITVPELTFEVQKMSIETFAAFEAIFMLAVGYWVLVELFSVVGRAVEVRINRHLTLKEA